MGRRKREKLKHRIIKDECNNISQEKLIEMQAEAYYRALKRIKDENKENEQKSEMQKNKWYVNMVFFLNICLWPWKINKRFSVSNRIYDSIPLMFVSFILRLVGGIMWFVGIVGLVAVAYSLIIYRVIIDIIEIGPVLFVLLLLGAIFIVAASVFEKETDSNKIYSYSASIIALVSCIVSIIALMGT